MGLRMKACLRVASWTRSGNHHCPLGVVGLNHIVAHGLDQHKCDVLTEVVPWLKLGPRIVTLKPRLVAACCTVLKTAGD